MDESFQEKIKNRLYRAWEEWKPDYEDWLKWSGSLYAPDAIIMAMVMNHSFSVITNIV